jgi:hypothetical protein
MESAVHDEADLDTALSPGEQVCGATISPSTLLVVVRHLTVVVA